MQEHDADFLRNMADMMEDTPRFTAKDILRMRTMADGIEQMEIKEQDDEMRRVHLMEIAQMHHYESIDPRDHKENADLIKSYHMTSKEDDGA